MLERDLSSFAPLFSGYTELRLQENRQLQIRLVKGSIVTNARSTTSGVSARVYRHGSWGFSSSPTVTRSDIRTVIEAAVTNAQFLDAKQAKGKPALPRRVCAVDKDFSTTKERYSQKDLLEFLREVDAFILQEYPDLTSRQIGLGCLDMEKSLLTSDGSRAYSMIPRANLMIGMSVEKDDQPVELFDVFGGLGQVEDVFATPADLYPKIDKLYAHLHRKKEGVHADAGVKECILDAELAGILAHEAIGHTVEADLVIGGSVAPNYLNQEAASPLVSLVDFAHAVNGQTLPVPVYVDDEGTKAEDAVLIDQGILKGYLHNKESAVHLGAVPSGNARAFGFSDEPLIRMRNTAFLPGNSNLEDMIASIDDGYYLIRPNNGQADSTSEFMFGVVLGYEIKGGQLGRATRDTTISGVAFDVLRTVSMVSDTMYWSNGGMCGKKQLIPTGMGGPAIKCRVNIGGR